MTCNACSRTTSAILALAASGCLIVCGTTAALAAGENTTTTNEGWSTQVQAGNARVTTAAIEPNAKKADSPTAKKVDAPSKKKVSAPAEKKTDDKTAGPAAAKRKDAGGKKDLFQPDPEYEKKYSVEEQVDIYGAKSAVEPPRPLLELGREQYTSGMFDASSTLLGDTNLLLPGLAIYGDWRTAVAYNNNNGKDIAQIATRLNLDVDFKITGTERLHAFFTPLQENNNKFTRYEFGGGDGNENFNDEFDFEPQTLFFEGDVGSLYSGFSGQEASFDLPFTVGLFPLFLQNGIWANDAILGGAVSLPAKNSAALGLANFDVTFFAAFDNVDNAGLLGAQQNSNANIFGVTTFIDAFGGYIEAGYGLIQGKDELDGQYTNFLTASYSRRYANTVSNSTRFFANFGNGKNDEGYAIISENSLITSSPNVIPYANFFVGFGNPQPLVDGNGAGILKNVGINFETDALTGYPKLDDSGSAAYGGAIGLIYLFGADLGQQLVFEVATVQPFEDDGIGAQHPQYGFGIRYQIALTRAWLLRADATYQIAEGAEDNFGVRLELRRKF